MTKHNPHTYMASVCKCGKEVHVKHVFQQTKKSIEYLQNYVTLIAIAVKL